MLDPKNTVKVCLVASAGGHLTQLLTLTKELYLQNSFFITTSEIVRDELQKFGKIYIVGECNRYQPWKALKVLLRCIKPILLERPDVVISTGASVGCFTCFLSKVFNAKVIWIDSITNVEKLSLSGWLVKFVVDLFIVQWPELNSRYKNVKYFGNLV